MLAPLTEVMESLECAVFASDSEMAQELKRTQQLGASDYLHCCATQLIVRFVCSGEGPPIAAGNSSCSQSKQPLTRFTGPYPTQIHPT